MFDRTFLPEAQLEFVLVSDTHYMLDVGQQPVEFESRRRQSARAERALRLIASLKPPFVVHLGDLVQEYPETARYSQAIREAKAQLERCGVRPYHVAGNQDIGDKPDPTMPTQWVTPQSLATFHELFGRSWYSWDPGDIHFVVLNSQLLNTHLPEAEAQQRWVETDLEAHRGRRIFLFFHLGLFLKEEGEAFLGHYDNIAEPGRSWLINLIRRYQVEMVFSGHSHFAFFNRIGQARYFNVVSTSFTRPGFSQLFSSGPPPEQGRDDARKLGFYLIRIFDQASRVHFIRSYGETAALDEQSDKKYLLSRTSPDLPSSPLGLILRHPLTQAVDVPLAWPSIIRQPVRNDYPFLSCIELGAQRVTVPAADLGDPLQSQRLAYLREEGVQIRATCLWSEGADLLSVVEQHRGQVDEIELQLVGSPLPDEACLREMGKYKAQSDVPLSLSTVIPREPVPGKQHLRTRFGYRPGELAGLNGCLAGHDLWIDRVLCRVEAMASPWETMKPGLSLEPPARIGAIDWAVEFATTDERVQAIRAAEALLAASLLPGSRLFLEPLVDLDRTMDITYGLLDRMHNPRPVFQVVRCLNTILFSLPEIRQAVAGPTIEELTVLGIESSTSLLWLLWPSPGETVTFDLFQLKGVKEGSERQWFDLEEGVSRSLGPGSGQSAESYEVTVKGLALLKISVQ